MAVAQEIVAAVRGTRAAKGLSPRQALDLNVLGALDKGIPTVVITKLANINGINENAEKTRWPHRLWLELPNSTFQWSRP